MATEEPSWDPDALDPGPDLSQVVQIAASLLEVTQSNEALLKNLTEVVAAMAIIMRDHATRVRDDDGRQAARTE